MLLKIRSVDKRCKLLPDKHEATFVFVKNKMMYKGRSRNTNTSSCMSRDHV